MGFVRQSERLAKAMPTGRPRVRLSALEAEVRRRVEGILAAQAEALGLEAEELVRRLGVERIDDILDRLPWDRAWEEPLRRELAQVTRQVLVVAAQAELGRIGGARIEIAFDTLNPRALEHARDYIPELVREVTQETREAIRGAMARGFSEGRTARQVGRDIRGSIGLTQRQAETVERLRDTLEARGLAPDEVQRRVEREHARQIRRRAELIARTETIRAFNTGQQAAWEQAAGEGYVEVAAARRFWIASRPVTQGGRTCEVCDAIARENRGGVGLNEPFRLPTGGTIMMPPAHPACRCSVGLRFE